MSDDKQFDTSSENSEIQPNSVSVGINGQEERNDFDQLTSLQRVSDANLDADLFDAEDNLFSDQIPVIPEDNKSNNAFINNQNQEDDLTINNIPSGLNRQIVEPGNFSSQFSEPVPQNFESENSFEQSFNELPEEALLENQEESRVAVEEGVSQGGNLSFNNQINNVEPVAPDVGFGSNLTENAEGFEGGLVQDAVAPEEAVPETSETPEPEVIASEEAAPEEPEASETSEPEVIASEETAPEEESSEPEVIASEEAAPEEPEASETPEPEVIASEDTGNNGNAGSRGNNGNNGNNGNTDNEPNGVPFDGTRSESVEGGQGAESRNESDDFDAFEFDNEDDYSDGWGGAIDSEGGLNDMAASESGDWLDTVDGVNARSNGQRGREDNADDLDTTIDTSSPGIVADTIGDQENMTDGLFG